MKSILAEVAEEYDVDADVLRLSQSRKYHITRPRQDFMWRCRQVKFADGSQRYSLPQIAAFLGGMDHTTVLWGVRAHARRIAPVETSLNTELAA
jgi:chromosomal replication initiation ATPase DnaA